MRDSRYVGSRNRNLLIISLIIGLGLCLIGDAALGGAVFLTVLLFGWKREDNTRERSG
jgi:hypothetical protein